MANPVLRRRTGMGAAKQLARIFKSEEYRRESRDFWAQRASELLRALVGWPLESFLKQEACKSVNQSKCNPPPPIEAQVRLWWTAVFGGGGVRF